MKTDIADIFKKKLDKGIDAAESFAFHYKKGNKPWDISGLITDLEEGKIDSSIIADVRAKVALIDASWY